MHMTRIGFRIELALYGPRYGRPAVTMSAWPRTPTACWAAQCSSVTWWTGLTAPAVTPVTAYGAVDLWNAARRSFGFMRSVVRLSAANVAWSRGVQRASGFARNASGPSNMSLLRVVSMWKIGTAASTMSPCRAALLCNSDFDGSMNERLWRSVWTLWCALTLLYVPSPT